ncbi:MAG: TetR/AcrR family transcriptional regulator [Polyangiaceae bacterium]|nr:TetR/AcrR family transcriptional regulator [Polyangiaceae bacterium]
MAIRKNTAERQREIADAALRIIATRGISALKVATLAAEIGLTGGALYRHFASTDAILDAVAARAVELLTASLPDPALPSLAWLDRFAEMRAQAVGGHAGLARLLFSEQLALAFPETALDRLRGVVKTTSAAIARALAAGQIRGEIRRDVEASDLVPIVMATVQVLAQLRAGTLIARAASPAKVWATLRTLLAPEVGGRR